MQDDLRTRSAANRASLSQHNPGSTRLGLSEDERRRAALVFLREYYRSVELGRAPLD